MDRRYLLYTGYLSIFECVLFPMFELEENASRGICGGSKIYSVKYRTLYKSNNLEKAFILSKFNRPPILV
jgi:hypothetical protein